MFLKRKAYRAVCCVAVRIQARVRGIAANNLYLNQMQSDAAVTIQTQCRHDLVRLSYLKKRNAAIITQSVCRTKLAEKKLLKLRVAAGSSSTKLEKQIKELTSQLEAKDEELSKLRSFLKEITEYPVKEEGASDIEIGKLPQPEDMPITGNDELDKLTAENIRLKYAVTSLQRKTDETLKLCEERSKQASDAESMVIELKTSMQSLNERIMDMESEEEILRQQVMMNPSNAASIMSHSPTKDQQNGSPHCGKLFDSNLTRSANERQNENVDALLAAVRQELGFSRGKPVATYIIYKSLLQWKYFEAERTAVFDHLINMIGSAIEIEHGSTHMAYWLSTTSTLLFLLHKSLSPAGNKGFNKSSASELVRHVEAKYPALLFKQQLTAYVEKIYAIIRDNLKKDLSPHISSCIQAAKTLNGNSPSSNQWGSVTNCLNGMLAILKEYHVTPVLIQKIVTEGFSYINAQLFNSVLLHQECCTFKNGEYVKAGLADLEKWCKNKKEYAGSASDELQHTKQTVGFLIMKKKSKIGYDELTTKLCPVLGVQQHHRLCTLYKDDHDTETVTPEVISKLKVFADNERGSYLLDDNSSMHFQTGDIDHCFKEKDFADMKPSGDLLENPNFHFLLE